MKANIEKLTLKHDVARAAFHLGGCLFGWALVHPLSVSKFWLAVMLGAIIVMFTIGEIIRLSDRNKPAIAWMEKWYRRVFFFMVPLERLIESHEEGKINASLRMMLGFILVFVLAPRWILAFAVLLLGMVDTAAKLGKYFPIQRFHHGPMKGKSVGGLLYGLIAGVACIPFILWVDSLLAEGMFGTQVDKAYLTEVYVVGIVAAGICELIGGKWDNFWLPVGAVLSMMAVT